MHRLFNPGDFAEQELHASARIIDQRGRDKYRAKHNSGKVSKRAKLANKPFSPFDQTGLVKAQVINRSFGCLMYCIGSIVHTLDSG
ncbi:hypothetical protein [Endozoicomonas sp. GU-1]|uniref:hypothetical protein n=1 Tax=Endozoicomonas sp. GU-1 TaxID=3009078 RepID=UPI0022B33945|nr:hypothetical protein [Endozoicomonas sp. GU-1]WBA79825.1 hypothetical protein O2T12_15805 [Endozoicomonas sp. GU-1]